MQEPSEEVDAIAHAVVGAAIEVHRELGPGFLEGVYGEALAVELALRKIPFLRQPTVGVRYKGVAVGEGRPDLIVGGLVIVELKTVAALHPIHRAQVISYLKASGLTLGLLLNFKGMVLKDGLERIIYSR